MKKTKDFTIGADIEDISRFRKLDHLKNSSFLNKIFTKKELDYCFSKQKAAPYLAARFAGKEAVVKALSNISKKAMNYKDIEILNNNIGAPEVKIMDKELKNLQIYISLSHCQDKAVAFVLVTKPKRQI